ncbi:MAG: MATE family efflux transporter [Anaerolineae bacterium]|jgi:putative MATE family efflux protein|nr:MATE family efflux transporter [Chloroflexota bacterium]
MTSSTPNDRAQMLTTGPVGRLVAALAVPAVLEQGLLNVVRLADTYWMGKVGDMAVAAVAMGTTLRMVLISPMMGLSMGGMALVARHVGEGNPRLADRATMQLIMLIALFTLPITAIGIALGPALLRLMGAKGAILESAVGFLRIVFAGLFFVECLPTMSGVIKGAGRPEYTLRINLLSLVVVALLEPVLVLGLGPFQPMGIRGAALATVLGSVVGVMAILVILLRGSAGLRLHRADVVPDLGMIRTILRISLPASVERLSPNLGMATLMRIVSRLGDRVLTGYSIFQQLHWFLQAVTLGIGNAAATMMGQNLGAGKPDRSERATRVGGLAATVLSLALYGLLAAMAPAIVGLFTDDPAAIRAASLIARVTLFGSAVRGWGQVLGRSLGGAGDTLSPMAASIGALWIVQLPASWLLGGWLGPTGVWLGMVLGDLSHAAVVSVRFFQRRWRTIRV